MEKPLNLERKNPLHFESSASGKNLIRGSVYADNYYIWNNNSWIPYSSSITSLTGAFAGDGSGLTGIVASADVDWTNVSATGIFIGDGSGLTGITMAGYLPLGGGTLTGLTTVSGSHLRVYGSDPTMRLVSAASNQYNAGAIQFMEIGESWDVAEAYGYMIKHNGLGNNFEIDVLSAGSSAVVMKIDRADYKTTFNYGLSARDINCDYIDTWTLPATDQYGVNIHYFGGQSLELPSYQIPLVIHNYTNGKGMQIDQCGPGTLLQLRNTNNETNFPGSTGSGNYLRCEEEWYGHSSAVFTILNDSTFYWNGAIRTGQTEGECARFWNGKMYDSKFAFSFNTYNDHHDNYMSFYDNNYLYAYINLEERNLFEIISAYGASGGMSLYASTGNIYLTTFDGYLHLQKPRFISAATAEGDVFINGSTSAYKDITIKRGAYNTIPKLKLIGLGGDPTEACQIHLLEQDGYGFVLNYNGNSNNLEFKSLIDGVSANLITINRASGLLTANSISSSDVTITGTFIGDGSGLTNVSGTDVTYYNYRTDTQEPNGFPKSSRNKTQITFSDSNKQFKISLTTEGTSYSFWANGTRFIKTASDQVILDSASGLHYIYFDETGTLTESQSVSIKDLIEKYAYVGNVYWNNTSSSGIIVGDERHGMSMDSITHSYLHRTAGAVYVSGLQIGDIVIGGSTLSVSNGSFYDEDIEHIITDSSPQELSTTAYLPVFALTGNDLWQIISTSAYPYTTFESANRRLSYNEWTGSTWKQTEVSNNYYTLSHIFATNDIRHPIIVIQGQNQYLNASLARSGANTEIANIVTAGLPMAEFIAIATVIFQTNNTYTYPLMGKIIATDSGGTHINWTSANITAGAAPSDHGLLTGLGDDDHSQYWLLGNMNDSSSATYRTKSASLSGNLSVTGDIYGTSLSANSITSNIIKSSGNNSGIFLKSNGFIGVGSANDPTYIFHVASGGVVRNYIESTDSGQASTDLRSGAKHLRMITDSSFIWRLYDQTSGRAVNLFTIDHNGIGKYLGPSFTITGSLSAQSISSSTARFYGEIIGTSAKFNNTLTALTFWASDGDLEGPSYTFAQNPEIGMYRKNSGIGFTVARDDIFSISSNSVSSHKTLYAPTISANNDIYANNYIYCSSISAAGAVQTESIYSNTFYYKTAANVKFYCEDSYHYIFNGLGGASFQGSVSANNFYGSGSGLFGVTDVNALPLSGGLLTGVLSASVGIQTNQILPIDVNNDSIEISTNQNLNLFSVKDMSISSNGNINIESTQILSLTGASGIDLYGNTRISGSLSATQPISGYINSNAGFVLENRTSDPVSPEIGRIWFRVDL